MASINMASIMNKVGAYSRSVNGKLRMQECIQNYTREGRQKTEAGSKIINDADMQIAASKMIELLKNAAMACDLPASVMSHFNSLTASAIERAPDGSAIIYIRFGGDLHRKSLYEDEYDGVDNIVALLNNGYHANNYVYGSWDGHSPKGESVADVRTTEGSAYIRSRKNREGLGFIQRAVQDFNSIYGSEYNVTAEAGDDYN